MCTAVMWECKNTLHLRALKGAWANKDLFLVDKILNKIAPYPKCNNAQTPGFFIHTLFDREVEIIDPETNLLDNSHGPAVVRGDGTRKWYRAGMLHNASGPAVIMPNGDRSYFYLGTRCKTAAELDETVESAKRHAQNSMNWRNVAAPMTHFKSD